MTPYRRELQAARAKLRALQKQHGGLLQDRDLLQAKLRVLPVALQSADEAQRWLVFARATFSRHSRQVLHQQVQPRPTDLPSFQTFSLADVPL